MNAAFLSVAERGGRRAISVAALMTTYMQAVNISLPNAALPHIQGTLSMADDEAGWVFSSYIAAGAAISPMSHWLAGRYGRKKIYQFSLAVFALALILVTLATHFHPFRACPDRSGSGGRPRLVPYRWRFCSKCRRPNVMPA